MGGADCASSSLHSQSRLPSAVELGPRARPAYAASYSASTAGGSTGGSFGSGSAAERVGSTVACTTSCAWCGAGYRRPTVARKLPAAVAALTLALEYET